MVKNHELYFNRIETCIFYVLILTTLFPLLNNYYFVSMDGPAHLYNATILNNLLVGDGWFGSCFSINNEFIPNWFGHMALLFLKLFLSGAVADKLFLIICTVLLPLTFRYLIKQVSFGNSLFSYFIFPFSYAFSFTMGFYNFSFSLIFLFIIIGYYIKYTNNLTITRKLILTLLFILCYFSHLFSFISSILIISCYNFFEAKHNAIFVTFKSYLSAFFKKQLVLLLCSLIPLILTGIYFFNRKDLVKNETFISKENLTKELFDFRAFISYAAESEQIYLKIMSSVFVSFGLLMIYFFIANKKLIDLKIKNIIGSKTTIWLLSLLIYVFLYYYLPDSDGSAGYISVRIAMMIYLVLIILFSLQNFNRNYILCCIVIFTTLNLTHLKGKNNVQETLNVWPIELSVIENVLPVHSTVFPVNLSENWLAPHIANYLASNKDILILENYEASNNYFPIKWNFEKMPRWQVGGEDLFQTSSNQIKNIDFVLLHGHMDGFKNHKYYSNVIKFYKPIFATNNFILFKIKALS